MVRQTAFPTKGKGNLMANPLYDRLFGIHAGKVTPFLHLPDGQTISHQQFLETSSRIAHVTREIGLKPGDRVAAQIEKSPEALALYAACAQAGLIFLPLNTAYTVDELQYFIENSSASLIVCDGSNAENLAPIATTLGSRIETLNGDGSGSLMDRARKMDTSFATVARQGDDLAAFLYTSGTTGRSKGAMLTQNNLDPHGRMAVHGKRRSAACPADLSHPWIVCCHQHHAGRWRQHDLSAEIRSGPDDCLDAPRNHHDGCSDLLYPPAGGRPFQP
jgi:malonyl-CoA/methylmalonyl-CoA synthetase